MTKHTRKPWLVSELKALIDCESSIDGEASDWKRWYKIMIDLENHPGWTRDISMTTTRRRCKRLLSGVKLTKAHFTEHGPPGCLTFPNHESAIEASMLIREKDSGWEAFPAVCDGSYRLPEPKNPSPSIMALTINPPPSPSELQYDDLTVMQAKLQQVTATIKSIDIRLTRLEKRRQSK